MGQHESVEKERLRNMEAKLERQKRSLEEKAKQIALQNEKLKSQQQLLASDKTFWECFVEGNKWAKYDPRFSDVLEKAFIKFEACSRFQFGTVSFIRDSIPYVVKFDTMEQKRNDGVYQTSRRIRRQQSSLESSNACANRQVCVECNANFKSGTNKDGKPHIYCWPCHRDASRKKTPIDINPIKWSVSPAAHDGARISFLDPPFDHSTVSRETQEANFVCGIFHNILGQEGSRVKIVRIQVIEYENDSKVWSNFREKKRAFDGKGKGHQCWVFHGSCAKSMSGIITQGFKVGGEDVAIVNGSMYGSGVYTATGLRGPMAYATPHRVTGTHHVVLAKGLTGDSRTLSAPDGHCDSWIPRNNWLVFRSGEQLLPCYIVEYSNAERA